MQPCNAEENIKDRDLVNKVFVNSIIAKSRKYNLLGQQTLQYIWKVKYLNVKIFWKALKNIFIWGNKFWILKASGWSLWSFGILLLLVYI